MVPFRKHPKCLILCRPFHSYYNISTIEFGLRGQPRVASMRKAAQRRLQGLLRKAARLIEPRPVDSQLGSSPLSALLSGVLLPRLVKFECMAVFQNNIYSNLKNKRDAVDMSKTGLLCSFYKSFHFHMGRVAEQLGIQL